MNASDLPCHRTSPGMVKYEEDWSSVTKLVRALVFFGNAIIALCGVALMALAIWVVTDPYKIYPFLAADNNTDIFAAAWIAIFCGFAFFLLGIFGMYAVWRMQRSALLAYFILMLIVFIFEAASCIVIFTHRDYLVGTKNLMLKQMLRDYGEIPQLTDNWKDLMSTQKCCGVDGPEDWISYTSSFSKYHKQDDADSPWPTKCCVMNENDEYMYGRMGCILGKPDAIFQKGCYGHFSSAVDGYTFPLAWFGFSILVLVFFVEIGTLYLYTVS
ncbi:uroplakin-1a-like isoform X1 [Lampetra fluviatilis]